MRQGMLIPKEMNLDVVGVYFRRENRKDIIFAVVLLRDVALFRRNIFQCSIIYQVIFSLFRRTLSLCVYTCTNRPEARCSFSNPFIAINMKMSDKHEVRNSKHTRHAHTTHTKIMHLYFMLYVVCIKICVHTLKNQDYTIIDRKPKFWELAKLCYIVYHPQEQAASDGDSEVNQERLMRVKL